MRLIFRIGFLCAPFFSSLFGDPVRREDLLSPGVGLFAFHKEGSRAAQLSLEYRWGFDYKVYRPLVGFLVTQDGSLYGYGGISLDLFFNSHWYLAPSFAAGLYCAGGGRDLGYPLEFRSGLEIGYRFHDHSSLSAQIYHMSNASLGDRNPGQESIVLIYSIPLYKLRGGKPK